MTAKLKWPHEYAGGTGAAPGRNGYRSENTPFGYWTVDPVTYPNGRHRGYVAGFVNDKGAVPGGLHQRIGGWSKVFRSAREAKAAAADNYAGLLVAQGVRSNPTKRGSRAAKLRRERDRLEKKLADTPTNVDASAIISRLGDLNVAIADMERKNVPKKNPRRRMGKQARKDFARRMAAARERKQAKKRVAIKRQISRAGFGPGTDPNASTKVLRSRRASTQPKGMYQIGALSARKEIAWFQGGGFTLVRGNARGYPSLAAAKAATRGFDKGLVAGIFRSDVANERARRFLLGKQ